MTARALSLALALVVAGCATEPTVAGPSPEPEVACADAADLRLCEESRERLGRIATREAVLVRLHEQLDLHWARAPRVEECWRGVDGWTSTYAVVDLVRGRAVVSELRPGGSAGGEFVPLPEPTQPCLRGALEAKLAAPGDGVSAWRDPADYVSRLVSDEIAAEVSDASLLIELEWTGDTLTRREMRFDLEAP